MKVGGNESATKFFQQNGGSAALNSKDPKTKYQSNAATKYKDELQKRAARDAKEYAPTLHATDFISEDRLTGGHRYPDEVVITDGTDTGDGSHTPSGEPDDDFFSSWDKPAIKKPTPPVSRTATPPIVGRTPSPFLSAGTNGKEIARAISPLAKSDDDPKPTPTSSRITTSAALRKTTTASGPRKANVLGAKKTQKLGVKKMTGDVIDFDEAEKKAREEAERIEKLGYDPDAEEEEAKKPGIGKSDSNTIFSPTPVSPSRVGYGSSSSHSREKSASEMERLGMGMGRLGFGQVGGSKPAAQKKGAGGFGSVGPIKATPEGNAPSSTNNHNFN
jgi:ADP-ribosylation factor GTPase-activating protein 2/3